MELLRPPKILVRPSSAGKCLRLLKIGFREPLGALQMPAKGTWMSLEYLGDNWYAPKIKGKPGPSGLPVYGQPSLYERWHSLVIDVSLAGTVSPIETEQQWREVFGAPGS